MSAVVAFLAEHGGALLAGSNAMLGAGALALAASRAPIHRQRLAELAVAAALCWLGLAMLPLPRFARAEPALPVVAPRTEWAAAAPLEPSVGLPSEPLVAMTASPLPGAVPLRANTPTSTAGTPNGDPVPWAEWLAVLYLAGTAVAAAYLLLGVGLLARLLRRAGPAPAWLDDLAARLSQGVLARAPRLLVTAQRCRPFCTGLRRPTIVLPADLCERGLEGALRHVLRHEIAHLRQRDSRGHTLFAAALPVFWFHPLYWWLRVRAHLAAELVADDLAARQSDGHAYVRSLIQFCERGSGRPLLGAVPVLRSSSEFYRRMNMLLEREGRLSTECSPLRRGMQASLACALVAVATGLWGVPRLVAQDPEPVTLRHLETEREQLRAEVQSLRHELKRLHKTLEAKERAMEAPDAPPPPAVASGPLTGVAGIAPTPARTLGVASLRGLAAPSLSTGPLTSSAPATLNTVALPSMAPSEPLAVAAPVGVRAAVALPRTEVTKPAAIAPRPATVETVGSAIALPTPATPSAPGRNDLTGLVDLVTRAIDLEGELEISRERLANATRQLEAAAISQHELLTIKVCHHTAERKLQAVRSVLAAERRATELELGAVSQDPASADTQSRMVRLAARLEVLRSID